MKKLILSFGLIAALFVLAQQTSDGFVAHAQAVNLPIGDFIATQPANAPTTIYISKEMVPFVEATGANVETKTYTTGWWIFVKTHYLYYYIANEFVDEVVEVRSLNKDIDSLIFMLKQLEKYASSYLVANPNTDSDVDNLVLGYIRNIDISYQDSDSVFENKTGVGFKLICGEFDFGFVDFVNTKESAKYTCVNNSLVDIKSYFASFVSTSSAINPRYGIVLERFKMTNKLVDPVGSSYSIDLVHMFCALSGLEYLPAGDFSRSYQLQSLISYIGDLHTACYDFGLVNRVVENFEDQVLGSDTSFSRSDFLADVDAMNIGRGFLTVYDEEAKRCNLVSEALAAYYEIYQADEKFRYQSFIKNISYQYIASPIEGGAGPFVAENITSTGINAFFFNVSNFCFLYSTNLYDSYNGILPVDVNYYFLCHPYSSVGQSFMPSYLVRRSMVKGFVNFVLTRAGYVERF